MSVRLPACMNTAATGSISVKFYFGDFYKNLLVNFTFGNNRTKISDALHETKVRSFVAGDIKSP
jgi:hypothetical protein